MHSNSARFFVRILLGVVVAQTALSANELGPHVHALSFGGTPKYASDFGAFSYVNIGAPKGGEIRWHATGTFNNFSPFTMKGRPGAAFYLTDDSLCVQSLDEPYTVYGLIAESMQLAADNSRIVFYLHPDARFHDGHPITARDVVFSYETLVTNLGTTIRRFFRHVEGVSAIDERTVEFRFTQEAPREMPLIVASLQVFPEHWWGTRDLSRTTLEVPVGSGPYRVGGFDQGTYLVYERVPDYWARNHPARIGQYNFDRIRYEYFRDDSVAFEAFKAGAYDVRKERSARNWQTIAAIEGVDTVSIEHSEPQGIEGFFFNTRRRPFDDRRVREALALAYDWDWVNDRYLFGANVRCNSFFTNSDLSAFPRPVPRDDGASASAEPYRRADLLRAVQLLREAGWVVRDGTLTNDGGDPLQLRILTSSATYQRLAQPWLFHLRRLGVEASVLLVDSAQFIYRMRNYDYDVIASGYGQRLWPGMEIRFAWHSEYVSADSGGRNLIGLADPEIDALIEHIIAADSREELRNFAQTLDRLLMAGSYVVPLGVSTSYRLAVRRGVGMPTIAPGYGLGEHTWWSLDRRAE